MSEVWLALRAEAARSGRGALARRLGVSTHTLQRILVDGSVPRFDRASVRQVRSWTRTLARLARHLGHPPRRWIEAAGIPWTDEARRIAAAPESARPSLPAITAVFVTPARLGGDSDPPALWPLVRQLCGAVRPGSVPEVSRASLPAALRMLESPGDASFPIVAGALDCAALRAAGREVLPVPGWSRSVRAIRLAARAPEPLPWAEVPREDRTVFLVAEGDAAAAWLLGHRGVPAAQVHALPDEAASIDATIEAAQGLRARLGAREALLVADEETALGMLHPAPLPPDDEAPSFRVALAVPAGTHGAHFASAWRDELFGSARAATAANYARILQRTGRELSDFPEADALFRRIVARDLLAGLLRDAGIDAGSTAADAPAWDGTLARARALLPDAWAATLDALGWAARRGTGSPHPAYCRSCATSLREHGGASPEYCRYCSDETGRLRPRAEVHEILAHWMEAWQDGLTHEAALARAERFMSAMPAWARN